MTSPTVSHERFVIQRRLGAGAFGVVYQVFDRERNTVVALETLLGDSLRLFLLDEDEFQPTAELAYLDEEAFAFDPRSGSEEKSTSGSMR